MVSQNQKEEPMEAENEAEIRLMAEKMEVVEMQKQKRLRLPLELECEVFKCLQFPIQCKFICGMGRGIYGIFGHKLLTKNKRLRNPQGNCCNKLNTKATLSPDGLRVCSTLGTEGVFARKGFAISPKYARQDHFPGTIIYYFEVTFRSSSSPSFFLHVGLSDGTILGGQRIGDTSNSYAIHHGKKYFYWLSNERHWFEWSSYANLPEYNGPGDVLGCGLLIDPDNELAIFFTLNGSLMGTQIPISPSVGCLFPTVRMDNVSLEFNFGDNSAKPFKFDVYKCPGMVFQ